MKLNLENELPDWLLETITPFGVRPIDFDDSQTRERAITHMDSVFGVKDAFIDWIVRDGPPEVRAEARRLLYEMDIDGFIGPYGTAWEANEGGAAAWWTPHTAGKLSFWEQIKLMPVGIKIVGWQRTIRGFSILGEVDSKRPDVPHWYLNNIAVAEDLQGQRYGSALMVPILWMADQDKVPVFLMIANPDNQAYYERFGFRLLPESNQPQLGDDVPFYKAMQRDPGVIEMTPHAVKQLLTR